MYHLIGLTTAIEEEIELNLLKDKYSGFVYVTDVVVGKNYLSLNVSAQIKVQISFLLTKVE